MSSKGKVVLAVNRTDGEMWRRLVEPRRTVVLPQEARGDPSVHYALAWYHDPGSLAGLPGLKAIFSLGAGVDHLLGDRTLPDVPIVRVVDDNLTAHMSDYVCWRVLDHHRQGRLYREQQAARLWQRHQQTISGTITVGILGLGHLGRAAADKLLAIGYRVAGWNRSGSGHPGVETYGGSEGLRPFLASTDILVCLLPHTPATEGLIDYDFLSQLRRDGPLGGPVLINAGRGRVQRDADIVRALNDGILNEASLDVFENEPLDAESPLWTHPRVFITPHAAADSDPHHLLPPMLDQMDRHDAGEPLQNVVNRELGY